MRILTGIKPTGELHLGNFVGAIRPSLQLLSDAHHEGFLFIADGHALTGSLRGAEMRHMTRHVAMAFLAAGLDPETIVFYRQSAVPQVFELFWILATLCPKGLMNRAHAYKAAIQKYVDADQEDVDQGVGMGLYNYPILMAADILLFSPDVVPVGPDQKQHVEIARDLAGKFNQIYGETFVLPRPVMPKDSLSVIGLDGQKMSKSYGNTIPLFCDEKTLRSFIFKIKTTSQRPEEPKDPETCALFNVFSAFASAEQVQAMKKRYAEGIGWAEMKELTFKLVAKDLEPLRNRYEDLMANPKNVEALLVSGEQKARQKAERMMQKVRRKVGFSL